MCMYVVTLYVLCVILVHRELNIYRAITVRKTHFVMDGRFFLVLRFLLFTLSFFGSHFTWTILLTCQIFMLLSIL